MWHIVMSAFFGLKILEFFVIRLKSFFTLAQKINPDLLFARFRERLTSKRDVRYWYVRLVLFNSFFNFYVYNFCRCLPTRSDSRWCLTIIAWTRRLPRGRSSSSGKRKERKKKEHLFSQQQRTWFITECLIYRCRIPFFLFLVCLHLMTQEASRRMCLDPEVVPPMAGFASLPS
jgi:hypothetical protein